MKQFCTRGLTLLALPMLLLLACESEDSKPVNLPTLAANYDNVDFTAADVTAEITDNGGAKITEKGFCWGLNPAPDVDDNKIILTDDNLSLTLTNLEANTTYYVRAYAINIKGVAYSEELSFTTTAYTLPVVTTPTAVTDIRYYTALSGSEVTDAGNTIVTARGLCWSTEQDPTLEDNHTTDGTGSGEFASQLNSLQPNTTYYVRAYATNTGGTSYSDPITFETPFAVAGTLPIAHYDFNNRLVDLTGVSSGITLEGAALGEDKSGGANGSLFVNGLDTYASAAINVGPGTNSVSVSAWVATTSPGYSIIESTDIRLAHLTGGSLYFTMVNGSTVSAGTNMSTSAWHHVVGVYDAANLRTSIYVDGVFKNSYTESGTARSFNSTMNILLGKNSNNYWGGLVDNLRFYDYALSAQQIEALASE